MKAWIVRPEGKACPVCRVPIRPDQLQRFSLDNPNDPAQAQAPAKLLDSNEAVPQSRREIQYNFVNPQTMQDVQSMEMYGSYGSKIETLVQHLLYIETTDPGAKSIVFSAWADSLLSGSRFLGVWARWLMLVKQSSSMHCGRTVRLLGDLSSFRHLTYLFRRHLFADRPEY